MAGYATTHVVIINLEMISNISRELTIKLYLNFDFLSFLGLYFEKNFCIPQTTFHENKEVNQQKKKSQEKKLIQFFSTTKIGKFWEVK